MSSNRFVVKYFDRKMLMTLDLNQLVHELLDTHGDQVSVEFVPMDAAEQKRCSSRNEDLAGLIAVEKRFWLHELDESNQPVRRPDLEARIVDLGQK